MLYIKQRVFYVGNKIMALMSCMLRLRIYGRTQLHSQIFHLSQCLHFVFINQVGTGKRLGVLNLDLKFAWF